MSHRVLQRILLASLLGLGTNSAAAEKKWDPGATDHEIKIGNIILLLTTTPSAHPRLSRQARKLVENDEGLLIFQTLRTTTNNAIRQYMNLKNVPQLFNATVPLSSASFA